MLLWSGHQTQFSGNTRDKLWHTGWVAWLNLGQAASVCFEENKVKSSLHAFIHAHLVIWYTEFCLSLYANKDLRYTNVR